MMCRPAFEYEDAKQELHNEVVNQLTIFLYVYSGFEAILNNSNITPCKKVRGKINAAKYHIKINFSTYNRSLPLYQESISLLLSLIDQKDSDYQTLKKSFSLDSCTDINGVGLKVVYKIRNLFAHGSFSFPEPLGHTYMIPVQPEIIKLSIRILLLSSQMIMIANSNNETRKIELYNSEVIEPSEEIDEEWIVDQFSFLRSFHTVKPKEKPNQLVFDFGYCN